MSVELGTRIHQPQEAETFWNILQSVWGSRQWYRQRSALDCSQCGFMLPTGFIFYLRRIQWEFLPQSNRHLCCAIEGGFWSSGCRTESDRWGFHLLPAEFLHPTGPPERGPVSTALLFLWELEVLRGWVPGPVFCSSFSMLQILQFLQWDILQKPEYVNFFKKILVKIQS